MSTKEERRLKKHLKRLIKYVECCVVAIDAEMKLPSSEARGKRIAAICNSLEMQKDLIKLDCGFMKIHANE